MYHRRFPADMCRGTQAVRIARASAQAKYWVSSPNPLVSLTYPVRGLRSDSSTTFYVQFMYTKLTNLSSHYTPIYVKR